MIRSPIFYILVLLAVLVAALLYLLNYNGAIKLNLTLTEKRKQLNELQEKVDSLRVRVSTLISLNRIQNFR